MYSRWHYVRLHMLTYNGQNYRSATADFLLLGDSVEGRLPPEHLLTASSEP